MKYKVQKGDTLTKIANNFNVSVTSIQLANPSIKDVNKIKIGDTLEIPTNDNVVKQIKRVIDDMEKLPSYQLLKNMLKEI